jgi:hypothetical protein
MKVHPWILAAGVGCVGVASPLIAQGGRLPVPQRLEQAFSQTVATDSQFRRFERSESQSALLQEKLTCPKLLDRACRPKSGRPLLQLLLMEVKSDRTAIAAVLVIEPNGSRLVRYLFFERKSDSNDWIRVPPFDMISVPHPPTVSLDTQRSSRIGARQRGEG